MYVRIKQLREEKLLTQAKIAADIHCNANTYWNYETGKNAPTASFLIRLARYHMVSTDYLLGLTDVRDTYPYPAQQVLPSSNDLE